MNPFTALPSTVDALIDMLDQKFPLQHHSVDAPMSAIQRSLGARDVVVFLRSLQKERDGADE